LSRNQPLRTVRLVCCFVYKCNTQFKLNKYRNSNPVFCFSKSNAVHVYIYTFFYSGLRSLSVLFCSLVTLIDCKCKLLARRRFSRSLKQRDQTRLPSPPAVYRPTASEGVRLMFSKMGFRIGIRRLYFPAIHDRR